MWYESKESLASLKINGNWKRRTKRQEGKDNISLKWTIGRKRATEMKIFIYGCRFAAVCSNLVKLFPDPRHLREAKKAIPCL